MKHLILVPILLMVTMATSMAGDKPATISAPRAPAIVDYEWTVVDSLEGTSSGVCTKKTCLQPQDTIMLRMGNPPDPSFGNGSFVFQRGEVQVEFPALIARPGLEHGTSYSKPIRAWFVDTSACPELDPPIKQIQVSLVKLDGLISENTCEYRLRAFSADKITDPDRFCALAKPAGVHWRIATVSISKECKDQIMNNREDPPAEPDDIILAPLGPPDDGQGTGSGEVP